MKRFLYVFTLLAAVLPCSVSTLSAQQAGASPQANPTAQVFPQWLVVAVLQEARPILQPSIGLNLGQMIQAYRNGGITIEYLCRCAEDQTKGVYRVGFGGGSVLINIMDNL
jgi:hypothetical protein